VTVAELGERRPGRGRCRADRDGTGSPWEIIYQEIDLHPEPPGQRNGPAGVAARVLGRITDYEIIRVQATEIAHLRSVNEGKRSVTMARFHGRNGGK